MTQNLSSRRVRLQLNQFHFPGFSSSWSSDWSSYNWRRRPQLCRQRLISVMRFNWGGTGEEWLVGNTCTHTHIRDNGRQKLSRRRSAHSWSSKGSGAAVQTMNNVINVFIMYFTEMFYILMCFLVCCLGGNDYFRSFVQAVMTTYYYTEYG